MPNEIYNSFLLVFLLLCMSTPMLVTAELLTLPPEVSATSHGTWIYELSNRPRDIDVSSDGHAYTISTSTDLAADPPTSTYHVVKWTPFSQVVWSQTWDESESANAFGIAAHDEFVCTAGSIKEDSGRSIHTVKRSLDGPVIWQKTWQLTNLTRASDVDVSTDGSIYVLGSATIYVESDTTWDAMIILKYDSSGNLIWNATSYDCSARDMKIEVTDSGNFYAFDEYFSTLSYWDGNGTMIWSDYAPYRSIKAASEETYHSIDRYSPYTIRKKDSMNRELWNANVTADWAPYIGYFSVFGAFDVDTEDTSYVIFPVYQDYDQKLVLVKYDESGVPYEDATLATPFVTDLREWLLTIEAGPNGAIYALGSVADSQTGISMGLAVYFGGVDLLIPIILGVSGVGVVTVLVIRRRQSPKVTYFPMPSESTEM